jgi:hypothetical protein
LVVEEVVVAVSVEVCAVVLLKVSEDEEKSHVGLVALEGAVVTAQVSVTVPVKELPGVTVIVEVPVVEPELMVMAPLLVSVKLVLLLPLGACQKFPQPARSGVAASNNRANLTIIIAAPLAQLSCRAVLMNPYTGYRLRAHLSCRAIQPASARPL